MHMYDSRASKYKAGGVRTPNSKEVKNDGQKWPIEDANVETLSFSFSITEWKMMDASIPIPVFCAERNWESEKTNWLVRLVFVIHNGLDFLICLEIIIKSEFQRFHPEFHTFHLIQGVSASFGCEVLVKMSNMRKIRILNLFAKNSSN